jgi:hypothetical protein
MSKNRDDDFVATKVEKSFDDDGNTVVAEIPSTKKTNLNVIRQIGNKAGDKNFPTAKELLDSKQKPAKVITLDPNKKKD